MITSTKIGITGLPGAGKTQGDPHRARLHDPVPARAGGRPFGFPPAAGGPLPVGGSGTSGTPAVLRVDLAEVEDRFVVHAQPSLALPLQDARQRGLGLSGPSEAAGGYASSIRITFS